MTALAEKLKDAGADTVGAKLTTACVDGLRLYPDNARGAWDHVFNVFGRHFVTGLMSDMGSAKSPTQEFVRRTQSQPTAALPKELRAPEPYKPRIISQERLEKRRELQKVIRSKYKNSAGVSWSDVSWHELSALSRDGGEAVALIKAGPAMVPNNGCTVGDVLGVKETDAIIAAIRSNPLPLGGT